MIQSKLLFLHIPKTAGSTFKTIITQNLAEDEILNAYTEKKWHLLLKEAPNPDKVKLIQGHYNFGFHELVELTDYKYITFLRDPIDLTVSHFFHLLRSDNPVHAERLKGTKTIEGFSEHPLAYNVQTRILSGVFKYEEFIANEEENFQKALNNLEQHIDYLGIQESFVESIVAISHLVGWKNNLFVTNNIGTNVPKKISDQARKGIEKSNQLDRKLYETAVKKFENQINNIPNFSRKMKSFRNKVRINKYIKTPIWKIKKITKSIINFI